MQNKSSCKVPCAVLVEFRNVNQLQFDGVLFPVKCAELSLTHRIYRGLIPFSHELSHLILYWLLSLHRHCLVARILHIFKWGGKLQQAPAGCKVQVPSESFQVGKLLIATINLTSYCLSPCQLSTRKSQNEIYHHAVGYFILWRYILMFHLYLSVLQSKMVGWKISFIHGGKREFCLAITCGIRG